MTELKNGVIVEGSTALEATVPTVQYKVLCNHDDEFGCGKALNVTVELPLQHPDPDHALRGYLCPSCGKKHQAALQATQERFHGLVAKVTRSGIDAASMTQKKLIEAMGSIVDRLDALEGKRA